MKRPIQISTEELPRLSAFVAESWRRFPEAADPHRPVEKPDAEAMRSDPMLALRRYRQLASVAILWRDLRGEATISEIGQQISALAKDCLELALNAAEAQLEARFGRLLDAHDQPIRLAILGLGKLGGDELNFNSDIDLVLAFEGTGQSAGPRRLDAGEWLKQAARELIRLLDTVTATGRVWVVDTRLRPFGESGALVWSLPALEQYFLSEGRSWERYAWLKAAAIAGDLDTGQRLIANLQPFIYRRYLDYGIFDSLRDLHARIDANSRARSARTDIKRGAGGIRELEFLVQSQQILRGGRDPALRRTGFLPALDACREQGLFDRDPADQIAKAYSFMRILENRLQAMSGRQGQRLPDDAGDRIRLAHLMGHPDWPALAEEIEHHRTQARKLFAEQFRKPEQRATGLPLWPPPDDLSARLTTLGFRQPEKTAATLHGLHRRLGRQALSAEGRRRLERLMPQLLAEIQQQGSATSGQEDLLHLVEQISRRSAYLALLHERPATLTRLVRVFHLSQRVAGWIIASPQLIDDLLDPVHGFELPPAPKIDRSDLESSLWALSRWRQTGFLRTALAELDGRLSAADAAHQLSSMAETIVDQTLVLSGIGTSSLAVIAYGNLGAAQLHFDSDLDLVFLHQDIAAPRRVVQRLVNALQMPLPGGRLFEIDTRLRPNGRAGLLVSTLNSFERYQRDQAWTWEHQALIRARFIAGDPSLGHTFDALRSSILQQKRQPDPIAAELAEVRHRQRRERPETPLKRALTDLQFIAELGILTQAHAHPALIEHRDTAGQLDALGRMGWLSASQAKTLIGHFQRLLEHRHLDWLKRQTDVFDDPRLTDDIAAAWHDCFSPAALSDDESI